MDRTATLLVGALLVAPLLAQVVLGPSLYGKGKFNSAFWKLSFEERLRRVGELLPQWSRLVSLEIASAMLLAAGAGGLAALGAGNVGIGWVGAGLVMWASALWGIGGAGQGTLGTAAGTLRETGDAPGWAMFLTWFLQPLEYAFVIGTNLGWAAFGWAIVLGGVLAGWLGWIAIGVGVGIPVVAWRTRFWFPQMAIFAPTVLGVALIIEAL